MKKMGIEAMKKNVEVFMGVVMRESVVFLRKDERDYWEGLL